MSTEYLFKSMNVIKSLKNYLKFSKKNKKKDFNLPIEATEEIINIINISKKFSMTGEKRMYLLCEAVRQVKEKNLKGDFVECGVWKGGNIILLNKLCEIYNLDKKIYAYDTFDGMSEPEVVDKDYKNNLAQVLMNENVKSSKNDNIHCFSSYDEVHQNVNKFSNTSNVKFIKGKVEDTLKIKSNLPAEISILRLDTDFYSSTKIELETLYERLVSGGILIIDDYGHWQGARKAVDEFFTKKPWLHVVDYTCRYVIKE